MEPEQQTYEEQSTAMPEAPTFQEFSNFWAIGIVPIVLAFFAYKSLALKVQARNRVRQANAKQKIHDGDMNDIDWEEEVDETVMSYVGDKIKGKNK